MNHGKRRHSLKGLLLLLLLTAVCFMLSGCMGGVSNPVLPARTPLPTLEYPLFDDAKVVSSLYSEITLDDKKADIEERFGPGEQNTTGEGNNKFFIYRRGDYGVSVAYDSLNIVLGKVLLYDDVRQLAPLTAKPLEGAAYAISKGMAYDEAASMLGGDAIEVASARHTQEDGSELRSTLVLWVAEDGATLQGTLDNEKKFLEIMFQGIESTGDE